MATDPRIEEFKNTAAQLQSISNTLQDNMNKLGDTNDRTKKTIDGISKVYIDVAGNLQNIAKGTEGIKEANRQLKRLKKQQVKLDVERIVLLEQAKRASDRELKSITQKLEALIDAEAELKASSEHTASMSEDFKQMKKNSGIFSKLADSLRSIPGLGPLLSKPLQDAADVAAERGKLAGFLTFLNSTVKLLSGPALVKGLLTISSQTKDLRTNLGISNTQARSLRKEFTAYAQTTENSRVNTDSLVEAQNQLSSELGLGVNFSGETLENFIDQTKALGVSVKAASRLALVQQSLGDTSGEFADNLALSAKQAGAALGVNISSKEVFEEVGNLSATTLLNLRRNPKALGQAVAEAKKLGIQLNDIRGIASSLLDFESSISNELEAEVLTGRQLNLERARLAALKGDDLDLTREIASQVGTIADFESMNVIQREALAKSFGLNSDQMSEMLMKQEALNAFGERANDLSKEALENAFKVSKQQGISLEQALNEEAVRADAAENFQNAVTNLQTSFREFFVTLEPLLTKVSSIMADLAKNPTFRGISLIGAGVAAGASILKKLQIIPQKVFVVNEGMGGGGSLLSGGRFKGGLKKMGRVGRGGGFAGLAIGAAALGGSALARNAGNAGLASGLEIGGGALSGASTGAMIGSIIPGVGTAIGAGVGAIAGGLMAYLDDRSRKEDEVRDKQVEKLAESNTYLQQLAERTGNIYMDGNQVGNATVLSAYRVP